MTSYLVIKAKEGHAYPMPQGRYETSNEQLGDEIATALEGRGFLVQKQDTKADENET